MSVLSFYVPGPPRGKQRPRHGKGHTYTPAATVAAEKEIAWEARRAMKGLKLFDGPLSVDITALYALPASWSKKKLKEVFASGEWKTSKSDLDNIVKLLADALNGVVWQDDAQVVKLSCVKKYTSVADSEGLYVLVAAL